MEILRKIGILGALALALALLPLVRLARPILLIRWKSLRSERIGHFIEDPEVYRCEKDMGWMPKRCLDVFYFGGSVCNPQVAVLARRLVPVVNFTRFLARVNRWFPGGKAHELQLRYDTIGKTPHRDGVLARAPLHLRFSDEEDRIFRQAEADLGLKDRPYVACLARDSAYLATTRPDRDSSYHDFRDCDISTYGAAMRLLMERGNTVIRMGAVVQRPLDLDADSYLDYSSSPLRSPGLDVWLAAHCRFFLSSGSGLDAVATMFRRPVAYVNLIPLASIYAFNPHDLCQPKLLKCAATGRLLRFREVVEKGLAWAQDATLYREAGIDWVDNTEEEILDLADEMDLRLRGVWRDEPGDEDLIRRYWEIFRPGEEARRYIPSRLGARFLRRHRDLLDA